MNLSDQKHLRRTEKAFDTLGEGKKMSLRQIENVEK